MPHSADQQHDGRYEDGCGACNAVDDVVKMKAVMLDNLRRRLRIVPARVLAAWNAILRLIVGHSVFVLDPRASTRRIERTLSTDTDTQAYNYVFQMYRLFTSYQIV